jgi:hypothetical protein
METGADDNKHVIYGLIEHVAHEMHDNPEAFDVSGLGTYACFSLIAVTNFSVFLSPEQRTALIVRAVEAARTLDDFYTLTRFRINFERWVQESSMVEHLERARQVYDEMLQTSIRDAATYEELQTRTITALSGYHIHPDLVSVSFSDAFDRLSCQYAPVASYDELLPILVCASTMFLYMDKSKIARMIRWDQLTPIQRAVVSVYLGSIHAAPEDCPEWVQQELRAAG